jgi:hypothetical protein
VTYQFYDICTNNNPDTPYYVMGGTQDNGTDKWSGTTTWSNGLFADGMVCNIDPTTGTTVYAEIQFGEHYRNTNSGTGSWTWINSGLPGGGRWVAPTDLDPHDGQRLFTVSGANLYRSINGGNGWALVDNRNPKWISISPVDGDLVLTLLSGHVRYSTNGGSSWIDSAVFGFPTGTSLRVLAHPTDLNTIFVTFSGYAEGLAHVAMSTDRGDTWIDVTGDLPSQPVNDIIVDPDEITNWYIATDVGVWKSSNGGTNWHPFEVGLPNAVVSDLEIQPHQRKLVAGTHGRGAWEIDIPLGGTGARVDGGPAVRSLMLDAPWPNPVADRTLLRFAAWHAGTVSLDVYDVGGRRIVQLVELPVGDGVVRTTPWFPDDVPNGVYFAVLRAGERKITRKLVVAR